jgi:pilin isopeptide linkage protein
VKNDVDGKVVFTDLEYIRNSTTDDVGTHKYTVVEKLGTLGGVTYTDVEYTVIITVTDNEDGTLNVVRSDDIKDIEFINTYDAKGEIGLEARKVLKGRELKGGEFTFELYDANENLIQSVVNNADGTVVFDNLKYTLAEVGEYKFKLIEKAGDLFAVTYDDIEYEIIVTVTDNGDGTLNVVRIDGIEDLVFNNSYDVTEAGVLKIWDDNDNQDGIRPLELIVALMNGDVKVTEVTLNAENGWSATVTNLPKYENGVEIDYTWVEVNIPEGYTLKSMTKEGVITSIINPHIPEKINIEGGKLWTGETCAELTRPVSITVKLYADGVEIRSIEVTSINDWRFSFTDLDKYKDGKEIVYTLGEIEVPGYVTKIDDEHYILVNEWIPPEPPQTGDCEVMVFTGIVMIALTGLFIVRKKRKVYEAE